MRVAHILDINFGHVDVDVCMMRKEENLTFLVLYILDLFAPHQVGDIMVMLKNMQTI